MQHSSISILSLITLVVALSLYSPLSNARNDIAPHSIKKALKNPWGKKRLLKIDLYFGDQIHAKPQKSFRAGLYKDKANAFNKDDETACQIAFITAIIGLQKRAKRLGANAIVNIHSVYRGKKFFSKTQYECGAGAMVAGTVLKGTPVLIDD